MADHLSKAYDLALGRCLQAMIDLRRLDGIAAISELKRHHVAAATTANALSPAKLTTALPIYPASSRSEQTEGGEV